MAATGTYIHTYTVGRSRGWEMEREKGEIQVDLSCGIWSPKQQLNQVELGPMGPKTATKFGPIGPSSGGSEFGMTDP